MKPYVDKRKITRRSIPQRAIERAMSEASKEIDKKCMELLEWCGIELSKYDKAHPNIEKINKLMKAKGVTLTKSASLNMDNYTAACKGRTAFFYVDRNRLRISEVKRISDQGVDRDEHKEKKEES